MVLAVSVRFRKVKASSQKVENSTTEGLIDCAVALINAIKHDLENQYLDVFREVGLLNELRMSLIGHACTPLCESTSTRMYNNELNALFAEAAKPRTRQEKNWLDKDAKPERMRLSRLFF